MRLVAEWTLLAVLVGLLASYLVATSRRLQGRVFLGVCGLGMSVALYGWWVFFVGSKQAWFVTFMWLARREKGIVEAQPEVLGYFGYLGLPLSLLVGGSLAFAIVTFEGVFTRQQLRRQVYRGLALYLAIWILIEFGVILAWALPTRVGEGTLTVSIHLSSTFILLKQGVSLLLALGFLTAVGLRFPRRVFQVAFPLLAVLFFMSLVADGLRYPRPWEEIFFSHLWEVFFLISYFYVNVKYHENWISSDYVRRIPKTALFLVCIGVLREFPEYERLRKLLPVTFLATERILSLLDLILLVGLAALVLSDRVFAKSERMSV